MERYQEYNRLYYIDLLISCVYHILSLIIYTQIITDLEIRSAQDFYLSLSLSLWTSKEQEIRLNMHPARQTKPRTHPCELNPNPGLIRLSLFFFGSNSHISKP